MTAVTGPRSRPVPDRSLKIFPAFFQQFRSGVPRTRINIEDLSGGQRRDRTDDAGLLSEGVLVDRKFRVSFAGAKIGDRRNNRNHAATENRVTRPNPVDELVKVEI
jgi:hypothetical protein